MIFSNNPKQIDADLLMLKEKQIQQRWIPPYVWQILLENKKLKNKKRK